ncbi:hypothetical protein GP486_005769, partial [Trichoglossum hirsutum]
MLLGFVLWLTSVTSASAFYPIVPFSSAVPVVAPAEQAQTTSTSSQVPSDLSSGFIPNSIRLKVSYNGSASDGFKDGTLFSNQETDKQPLFFAFGDASSINASLAYIVLMVDTTSTAQRTLHFLQTDLRASGNRTQMNSPTKPAFPYRPPLAMGETGRRQYTFLLLQQKPTTGFPVKGIPAEGQKFDVAEWRAANGLEEAQAGITMKVDGNFTSGKGNSQVPPLPNNASTTTVSASASASASAPGSGSSINGASRAVSRVSTTVFNWRFTGL